VVYISNPVSHYDIEDTYLKFYGVVGEDPIAVFLADYIFICEKIVFGLSILYYSPVTCDCTTYCFTSFSNSLFVSLSEALNEFTFRGNYSDLTTGSDHEDEEDDEFKKNDSAGGMFPSGLSQTDPTI
jgi:hypothetical protein